MYSRDPFNLRKEPHSALNYLKTAATQTLHTGAQALEATKQSLQDSDMSFSLPRNVPNFENAQRRLEDTVWSKFSGNEKGLPMYKDKPANYRSRRGVGMWFRRKRGVGIILLVVFGLLYWMGWLGGGQRDAETGQGKSTGSRGWGDMLRGSKGAKGSNIDWEARRESVRNAFKLSWSAYEEHGWGMYIHKSESRKNANGSRI